MAATNYIKMFFAEKEIPFTTFEIKDENGIIHFIDTDTVIEFIKEAPHEIQDQIADMLRKIDFKNGKVVPFLEHIAGGMVKLWNMEGSE